MRPCRDGSLDPRYVPVRTVLECPRCTVTLAMAMSLRLLRQIITVSCCTMDLKFFQFSVFGGGSKLWCMLRRFARRAAAAAKKIGMRCDGLARAGGVDGGKRGTTSDGLRIGIGN